MTRYFIALLSVLAGILANMSCSKPTTVRMKNIGDPNAAVNREPPVVILVGSPDADGKYVTGSKLTITVKFSKAVIVGGDGDISLDLDTGASSARALYQSGTASDTLSLVYLIGKADQSSDLQYTSAHALSLGPNTTVRDEKGRDAQLALPSLSDASSLGSQKNLIINAPSSAVVDQNAGVFEDLGIHFEKSLYQTRSVKRLLIKESEVSAMSSVAVLINKNSFACSITPGFNSVLSLASLDPLDTDTLTSTIFQSTFYGTPQTLTLSLDGVGISPNETTEQVTVEDFSAFDFGSTTTSFDEDAQLKDGFQGWMSPVSGLSEGDDSNMVTGFYDIVNR